MRKQIIGAWPDIFWLPTTGAFVGGYLSLSLISEFSKLTMIVTAFFAAGLLLYLVRYRGRLYVMYLEVSRIAAREITQNEVSVGTKSKAIIVTILLVAAIFSLLV